MILILPRKEKSSILFIVKRIQFVVNHIWSVFSMNGLDRPKAFTIAIADLIALAPWIPGHRRVLTLTVTVYRTGSRNFSRSPASRPVSLNEPIRRAAVPSFSICDDRVAVALALLALF
jgi:hypothetical protein